MSICYDLLSLPDIFWMSLCNETIMQKSKYVSKPNSQIENAYNGLGKNEHKWVSVQHIRNPIDTNLWCLRSNAKNIQLYIWYKNKNYQILI